MSRRTIPLLIILLITSVSNLCAAVLRFDIRGEYDEDLRHDFWFFYVKTAEDADPNQDEVHIYINSPGGYVYVMWDVIDWIKDLQDRGFHIVTFLQQNAASAAANTFIFGDERVVLYKSSRIGFHMAHNGRGVPVKLERDKELYQRLKDITGDPWVVERYFKPDGSMTYVWGYEIVRLGIATDFNTRTLTKDNINAYTYKTHTNGDSLLRITLYAVASSGLWFNCNQSRKRTKGKTIRT